MYAKPTLNIEEVHTEVTDSQIELITGSLAKITITSVYKPPAREFEWPSLLERCRRPDHLVICDFNSHITAWGYEQNDCNGDLVEAWAEASNFSLIHDAKLPKYVDSARWKRGYNTGVTFVSTRIASICQRGVVDPIPRIDLSHTSAIFDFKTRQCGIQIRDNAAVGMVYCCVPGCKSDSRGVHLTPLSFHQLPNEEKEKERHLVWLTKIRRD